MKTTYLTADDLRSINKLLKARNLTALKPDTDARGAYLITALERLPIAERAEALAIVKAWIANK